MVLLDVLPNDAHLRRVGTKRGVGSLVDEHQSVIERGVELLSEFEPRPILAPDLAEAALLETAADDLAKGGRENGAYGRAGGSLESLDPRSPETLPNKRSRRVRERGLNSRFVGE